MELFKNKVFIVFFIMSIIGVYALLRLSQIAQFPIFTDEAIYIRWAQIAKNDASWRFISLTDGKQPMFVWIAMVLMRFVQDPLVAGRLVSVLAGFSSMIGLYFIGREIFKNSLVGIVSSLLYLVYPFALVYDRLALYDSLVGAFAVWSLYLAILLVRTLRLDIALILGMVIGGGVLTKTNAFFSLALLPFTVFAFEYSYKGWFKKIVRFAYLFIIIVFLTFILYSILRLSPFFHIITEKNALFVYPLKEWWEHPFVYLRSNFLGLADWFWKYMTIPWVILVPFSLLIDRKFWKEKIILIIWFLVPFIYLSFFGKNIYPRFIFFMTLSLLPLVAYSLVAIHTRIKDTMFKYIFLVLLFILPFRADYYILFNFVQAPIPDPDKNQYYSDWPSGVGVKEITEFFRAESQKGKIYIATEGTFGLMPFALEIYLVDNPNIILKGYWPIEDTLPNEMRQAAKKYPVYYVAYQPCHICDGKGTGPRTWPLKLVMRFEKKHNAYLSVFKITP